MPQKFLELQDEEKNFVRLKRKKQCYKTKQKCFIFEVFGTQSEINN